MDMLVYSHGQNINIKTIVNSDLHFTEQHCLNPTRELEFQKPIFQIETHVDVGRYLGVEYQPCRSQGANPQTQDYAETSVETVGQIGTPREGWSANSLDFFTQSSFPSWFAGALKMQKKFGFSYY